MEWPPDKQRLKKDLVKSVVGLGIEAASLIAMVEIPNRSPTETILVLGGVAAGTLIALPPAQRMMRSSYNLPENGTAGE